MSSKTGYKSNALIGMASQHMKMYRFSENEAKEVGMFPEDTGVIVLIILYLIDSSNKRNEKVCRSKLEYYLLLLDRMCFDDRGVLLFSWRLKKNGLIQHFEKFTEFMVRKELIVSYGNAYFELTPDGYALGVLFAELCNIRHWLDKLLQQWGTTTTSKMKAEINASKHSKKYCDAINNIRRLLTD